MEDKKILDAISDGILIIDKDYKILFANQVVLNLCKLSSDEVIGKNCHILHHCCLSPCDPSDHCPHKEVFSTGKSVNVKHTHSCPDGKERVYSITASPIRDENGNVVQMVEVLKDITAEQGRMRLSGLYSVLSSTNDAIIRIKETEPLLQEICRIIVEEGMFRMAWIGFIDPKTLQVKPAAMYGHEDGYLKGKRISVDESIPEGRGPTGTALRKGSHTICNDVGNDPIMLPWREEALKRGYRSHGGFALKKQGTVIGTFNVYSEEAFYFQKEGDEIIRLLSRLAENISFAIELIEGEKIRRQAEEELRENEKFLTSVVENIPNMIFVKDARELRFVRFNKAGEELLGYQREDLYGKNDYDFFPHEEAEFFITKDREVLNSKKLIDIPEETIETRHQGKRILHTKKIPIVDAQGDPKYLLGISEDITERKQAEEQIKAQQEFLQNALDSLTHPFYVIDANDYTIKLANTASHFGEYREGTKCFQLTHDRSEPCSGSEHPCSLREIRKTRQPVVMEHIHVDPAGMNRSVEIHAYPIFDGNGNLIQIIEYCLDISERKQGEEERRRLVTAIEQGIDSVVITDRDGIIQYVNPGFEKVTGYSKEEAIGQNPRILQSGKQDALFYQEMWRTLTSGKAWRGDLINKKKDGTLFEEEVSITPVLNEAGEIINYVAVKRDVTGEMQLEKQLRQAQKMEAIGTLAGGIAHDFNNILAPILGYSELALARISPGDPLVADLQQVITAAMRAKDLVQQILAFSRQAPQEKKPLQPHLVVKEALKLLRASLPSTIEIREEIPAECGAILADPTQFHQIVMNLCTNAYHAMRETGGVLRVRLAKITIDDASRVPSVDLARGDYVVLEISDTGCGMEQKTLAHIFDPYFTTKGKGEGTGLGLAVVHGIVKSYQGHITVYSEPGKGTHFHVYLPRIAETHPLTEANHIEAIPTGTERLLVVDDEAVITTMLEVILQGLGYQVRSSSNSLEALALIDQDPMAFDLLITDMTMPHLTGFELAHKALAIRPDLPIILCTGFSELINKEQAQALGIRAYLMKPVSMRELGQKVREVLDAKREKIS
ncbi:MAG: PAS domain S-box protein [Proteobacteria bacterium]|nr:PAS domain S-box protein [Pseudomonadota bacterium]MBU1649223.1 PAS domain S-box protein [Pseudomonadota bacterium]